MASSQTGDGTAGKRRRAGLAIGAAAAAVMWMAAGQATASETAGSLSEEDTTCLSCHGFEGLEKSLANGETLSLHIAGEPFAGSVHAMMGCTSCHAAVDLAVHPSAQRTIKSKHDYSVLASRACAQCHTDESLKDGPAQHAQLTAAGEPACSQCHNVHAVTGMAQWKADAGETDYCLTCHRQDITAHLANGLAQSMTVDVAALRSSVHLDHDCTDCHADFSKESHPVATAGSDRERAIVRAEVCQQCHADKLEQYEGSIHATLIRDGNLAAPVCTDCHGAHSVGPMAAYETIAGRPCKQCHENIFAAYTGSVHGQALGVRGHIEAPICADCHRAHDIGAVAVGARLKDACLGCHEGAPVAHKKWLPNAALHLDVVACPACHAPTAERRVDLRIYDSATEERIAGDDRTRQFADGVRAASANGNDLDDAALWDLLRGIKGNEAGGQAVLKGRLEVRTGVGAHQLSDKTRAVRDCHSCHRAGADPFQSVTVSIVGPDGRPIRYAAEKEVLSSPLSVDSVRGFYAVGGTRIKLLDIILALALLSGISVPVGHLAMKWLFRKFFNKAAGATASGTPEG